MKACVLHDIGDIRYEEVEKPIPGPEEVLVKVRACGVCGSDIPRVYKKGTYHFPTIPGHEFSGEIAEVGSKVDNLSEGDKGAVIPLIPCHQCSSCEIGNYAQCEDYNYLGSRTDGAFAEYVTAPAENFILLPEEVNFKEAAMVEPAAVAAHALRRAKVDLGNTVTVLGAGPIGIMIAQLAKIWGAGRVLIVDIQNKKLKVAEQLDFKDTFNSSQGDPVKWVEQKTENKGSDLVIEAAGVPETLKESISMVRKNGKITIMGNPSDDVTLPQKLISQILRKEINIFGSWNSRFTEFPVHEWKVILNLISQNRLDLLSLVTHEVNFSEINETLEMMRDNKEFYNKVLFVNK